MIELVADARREGPRVALALFLTPALCTAGPVVFIVNAARARELPVSLLSLAGKVFIETYPFLLCLGLAGLIPALALLVSVRQLTSLRLILLAALFGGVALTLWMPVSDSIWPPPESSNASAIARATLHFPLGGLYGLLNAGLFALITRPGRWAASLPRSPSS